MFCECIWKRWEQEVTRTSGEFQNKRPFTAATCSPHGLSEVTSITVLDRIPTFKVNVFDLRIWVLIRMCSFQPQ